MGRHTRFALRICGGVLLLGVGIFLGVLIQNSGTEQATPPPPVEETPPAAPTSSSLPNGVDCKTGAKDVPVVPGSKGDGNGDGVACES